MGPSLRITFLWLAMAAHANTQSVADDDSAMLLLQTTLQLKVQSPSSHAQVSIASVEPMPRSPMCEAECADRLRAYEALGYGIAYVHIPKNAGTTIEAAFGFEQEKHHCTASMFRDCLVGENLTLFTSLRNPYDRAVSAWSQEVENPDATFRGSFAEYLHWLIEEDPMFDLSSPWARPYTPQVYSIFSSDGEVLVSHFLHVETLDSDWKRLQSFHPGLPDLPEALNSRKDQTSYCDFYRDNALAEMVSNLYAEDFNFMNLTTNISTYCGKISQLSDTTTARGAYNGRNSMYSFDQCLDRYAGGLDSVDATLAASIRARPRTPTTTSNRRIVFGVGEGHTATRSLTMALLLFGLKASHRCISLPSFWDWLCHEYIDPPSECTRGGSTFSSLNMSACHSAYRDFDYTTLPHDLEAVADTPIQHIFLDLFLSFPNAKWVLTTRPTGDWVETRPNITPTAPIPVQWPCGEQTVNKVTPETLGRLFDLQNELVRCVVHPQDLFEINVWEGTDGVMSNLAKFLEVDAPDKNLAYPTDLVMEFANEMGLHDCCWKFWRQLRAVK